MMSISGLFYIIGGQFLVGPVLNLVPISGYDTGVNALKFIVLPDDRQGGRWYRLRNPLVPHAGFSKRFIATMSGRHAPRGVSEHLVLFACAAQCADPDPDRGGRCVAIAVHWQSAPPSRSLVYRVWEATRSDAINSQDFAIVRAMVFLGAVLLIRPVVDRYLQAQSPIRAEAGH